MCTEKIKELVSKKLDEIIALRREFHMHPEIGFKEHMTAESIRRKLDELGIEYQIMIETGVVALIKGEKEGKTVLIRADIDALEVLEEAEISYKSKIPGMMHACGHDGHTASLLGVAMVLNCLKSEIEGNVKLLFQPSEESANENNEMAADMMIKLGALENPKVDYSIATHLWGGVKEGFVETRYGGIMAAPDKFVFKIIGRGGHGSMPHLCIDPVPIATQIINTILISMQREVSPFDSAVISFCSIHGGTTFNIIPNEVEVKGTVRCISEESRHYVEKTIESVLKNITEIMGATYEFHYEGSNPPLINNNVITDIVRTSAAKIIGSDKVIDMKEPSMGGEDYAMFAQAVPSCMFFIGIAKDMENQPVHHNSKFMWDDQILFTSTAILCQAAIELLKEKPNV